MQTKKSGDEMKKKKTVGALGSMSGKDEAPPASKHEKIVVNGIAYMVDCKSRTSSLTNYPWEQLRVYMHERGE